VRQEAAESGSLSIDSGAAPQNPTGPISRPDDPIEARLREALEGWREALDTGELRRALLDLMMRLER
jgi:hypothetical protein